MKRAPGIIVVVLVVLVVSVASAQKKPSRPDLWPVADEAAALIKAGKYVEAKATVDRILKLDPKAPIGHTMRIHCLEKLGDVAGVIEACDTFAAHYPVGPEVKKPDPLRKHQLWHYHTERHKGEALMKLKRFDEAVACFKTADKLAFSAARAMNAALTARWQIAMKNRQADALWAAGKKEEAVALRRRIIAKFDRSPRYCNNCVRVKAALVRDLRALGKADEARKLLDATLADKRLDAAQRNFINARVLAESATEGEQYDVLTARLTQGSFIIRSAGRFELRVNLKTKDRYAYITSWYDLETDPLREVDLLDDNWFSIFKPHHLDQSERVDGKWQHIPYKRYVELRKAGKLGVGYKKDQNAFKVLENSPARVRFGYVNRSWPGETVTTTVYPDGRITVGTHWRPMRPDGTIRINSMGFYTGVSGTVNWRTTIGKHTGMFGSPYIRGLAPFTMLHSNEHYPTMLTATRADLAKCLTKSTGSYGNNTLFLAWFRTPVRVRFKPDETEAKRACFIHIWPNNRDSYEAALPYMQDYQSPAALKVTKGQLVTDDAGDDNADGFNETEGCYVVRARAAEVVLTIDGSKVKRFSPVFKVSGVKGTRAVVSRDGRILAEGKSVSTHVDAKTGTALVRVLGSIAGPTDISIAVK